MDAVVKESATKTSTVALTGDDHRTQGVDGDHRAQGDHVDDTNESSDARDENDQGGESANVGSDVGAASPPLASTPLPVSNAALAGAVALVAVPVVVLGIRALWKSWGRRHRGLSDKDLLRIARQLMVSVDEGGVLGSRVRGSSRGRGHSHDPDREGNATVRVMLADGLSRTPWTENPRHISVVGTARPAPTRLEDMKEVIWRGAMRRRLRWRSGATCGLVNAFGVLGVELGVADVACCVDDGGACSPWGAIVARGMFGYQPSRGVGVDLSDRECQWLFAAGDAGPLVRCWEAVGGVQNKSRHNQGAENPKRYLVAEDVFGVCEATMRGVTPSVIEGVKRWAGSEQAQSLSLCQWLFYRVSGVRRFLRKKNEGEGVSMADKPTTDDVLDALVRIRETLWKGLDASDPDVSRAENFVHAKMVAEELGLACQSAMDEGLVFVMPACPGVPPAMGAEQKDVQVWEEAVTRLNCLSALAGVPQVSIPVAVGGDNTSERTSFLGIGLLTRQRKDDVLLKSLDKLCGFIKADMDDRAGRVAKAARKDRRGADAVEKSEAEAEKELGNTCFKNKQYAKAIEHYTRSIAYDETNPVYPSNRAMAYLKLGQYEEAEEDCSRALRLDSCNAKALLRRGAARAALGSYEEAAGDYSRVLDIEPGNRQAKEELARLQKVLV